LAASAFQPPLPPQEGPPPVDRARTEPWVSVSDNVAADEAPPQEEEPNPRWSRERTCVVAFRGKGETEAAVTPNWGQVSRIGRLNK
jgi:hypothetical protein